MRLGRHRRLDRRLYYAKALGNDYHVRRCFADLECLFEQRRVEGGLQVKAEQRFRQSLTHFVEKAIEGVAKLRVQTFAELLLRIPQPLLEIAQNTGAAPEQSYRDQQDARAQKYSARDIE